MIRMNDPEKAIKLYKKAIDIAEVFDKKILKVFLRKYVILI